MRCQAQIWRGQEQRQCARDATVLTGPITLCWQHSEDVRSFYRTEGYVSELRIENQRLQTELIETHADLRRWRKARRTRNRGKRSRVYFAKMIAVAPGHRCFGLIKIGRSTEVRKRMETLGAEPILTIAGGTAEESDLHARFAHLRRHGEWFEAAPELVAHIESLQKAG